MAPLILYSTNTWLAYNIAERFYGGVHYVWCTPHFDARTVPNGVAPLPPTSAPGDVYHDLLQEVHAGDLHSTKIAQNRAGLIKGATTQLAAGRITGNQCDEITEIVKLAETRHFKPVLYVIPYDRAAPMLKSVSVKDRATPLSVEFIIEDLPRAYFDLVHLERRLA